MPQSNNDIEISIVIPCYNSERSLNELVARINKTLASIDIFYEIIFVNDCSKDNSLSVLKKLAKENPFIVIVDLMYNVGQHRAIMCGLKYSKGNFVITMDDDLQHPPEEIPKLYTYLKNNPHLDAAFGQVEIKNHSKFRNLGSLFVKKINEKILGKPKDLSMSAFRCLTRNLTDIVLSYNTMFPLLGPLILRSTNRIENVIFVHHKRKYGTSNYSLPKLIHTTFDNIINFSSLPLKYISILGVSASLLSFVIAIYFFIKYMLGLVTLPGWTSTILFINFYGGLLLLAVGIIGEYLIRILQEVNGYPVYKVRFIYGKDPFNNAR